MPMPRVYLETTIPSYYFDRRRAPSMVARRQWTRAWWEIALERYELVTSPVTLRELKDGPEAWQSDWNALMRPVRKLDVSESAPGIAAHYVRHRLMPARGDDALHLAVASVHRCEYLLTWDVQHLANAHKYAQIRKVNVSLGLYVPTITTPLEMLGRMP